MNRIDRLSAILVLLQSSTIVYPDQICQRFGLSKRTMYRDLKALEDTGIPIVGNSREGYSLIDGFKLPPMTFSREEALAFLTGEKLINQFTDDNFKSNYRSGIEKIKAVMLSKQQQITNSAHDILSVHSPNKSVDSKSNNILYTLLQNILNRKKIVITYQSYGLSEPEIRLVDPIGVFFSKSNWYLVAYCNQKAAYRTFRLDRIQSIEATDQATTIQHPSLDSFVKRINKDENLHEIILNVRNENLSMLDESKYYLGLIKEISIDNNYTQLHFMTFSINRFARWLLSYIDIVCIESPMELKLVIKSIINRSSNIL